MVWFRTQREVSEYFGKNPNDRSFISRRISRGLIERKDWGYEIVEKNGPTVNPTEIERLRWENSELKEKLKEYDGKVAITQAEHEELLDAYSKWFSSPDTTSSNWADDSDLEFQIQENIRLEWENEKLKNGIREAYKVAYTITKWKIGSWTDFKKKCNIQLWEEDE